MAKKEGKNRQAAQTRGCSSWCCCSCQCCAYVVAVVAVVIGVAGSKPEVLLHVPTFGFLLYMFMGGNQGIVPPYFDAAAWTGDEPWSWLRDGDVVVASAPKMGTSWLCYCVDAVRRRGRDDIGLPYKDVMLTTPWMDLRHQPGDKWEDRWRRYNNDIINGTPLRDYWDNDDFPFRVFKTHFLPRNPEVTEAKPIGLPVLEMPNVRYIVSVRNPFEVGRTLHEFLRVHSEAFRSMWGGFPPIMPDRETAMMHMRPGGDVYGMYFGYLKFWWTFAAKPNVLALHFSDMTKNVPDMVEKLAGFLQVKLTKKEREAVVAKCSFRHMKANQNVFDYKLLFNDRGVESMFKAGSYILKRRSGGDWRLGVHPHVAEQFEHTVESELDEPRLHRWALNGGSIYGWDGDDEN